MWFNLYVLFLFISWTEIYTRIWSTRFRYIWFCFLYLINFLYALKFILPASENEFVMSMYFKLYILSSKLCIDVLQNIITDTLLYFFWECNFKISYLHFSHVWFIYENTLSFSKMRDLVACSTNIMQWHFWHSWNLLKIQIWASVIFSKSTFFLWFNRIYNNSTDSAWDDLLQKNVKLAFDILKIMHSWFLKAMYLSISFAMLCHFHVHTSLFWNLCHRM